MMKKGAFISILALVTSIIVVIACSSTQTQTKTVELVNPNDYDQLMLAENMLRMDNFRDFEKAEVEFLSLRMNNPDNPHIDGWLAQLYVAWAEQLRTEVHVLKWQLSAATTDQDYKKQQEIETLIDFRSNQLEQVVKNAGMLCNNLVTYNQDNYISHRVMADYYRLMGDVNMMKLEMIAVERLNPKSVGLLFLKGTAMAAFDRNYQAAIGYYNKALEKDPLFIKALYFKGLAYHALKKPNTATNIMKSVLEKSPGHPGAQLYLDANLYISSLRKEIHELAIDTSTYQSQRDKDIRLIKWTCEWIDDSPSVSVRIRGDEKNLANLLVSMTLLGEQNDYIFNQDQVLQIEANDFKNVSFIFEKNAEKCKNAKSVLIKLLMKVPGSDDYKTIEMKKTFLPSGV